MPISAETFLKRLRFSKYEDFMDVELDCAAHKKSKRLTLREYKDQLQSGLSSKNIVNSGYDKHIISFYNALLQDKIGLSKEQFESEYLNGDSLDEISSRHKLPREHVSFLREFYGIKRKGATFIRRKKTEPALTEHQKQIIIGSFLGDGGRMGLSSLKIKHSTKQKDYLLWKYEQLASIVSPVSLQESETIDSRFKTPIRDIRFYTFATTFVETIIQNLYRSGVKSVNKQYLEMVDDVALAVWFADDGDTDWNHRSLVKGWESKPTCKLNTQSFSKEECEIICQWFAEKYGLHPEVKDKKSQMSGNVGYIIKFNTIDTEKLHDIVRPHLISSMRYKVDLDAYLSHSGRSLLKNYSFTANKCPLGQDFYALSHECREKWISGILGHLRQSEFPYPRLTPEEEKKFLDKVLDFDYHSILSGMSFKYQNDTSSFVASFHDHFYKMNNKGSRSLYELYQDDQVLRDAILTCIAQSNKPYGRTIVRALRHYRGNKGVGMFPVFGAKAVYEKYATNNSRVLDFCAGFGQRLIGAWAADKVKSYLGIDACPETVQGLNEIKNKCQQRQHKEITILHGDGVEIMKKFDNSSFDFIFTSPPYFNTERYSDCPKQSTIMFPDYSGWLHNWLFESINQSTRILSKDGTLIINIADCYPYLIAEDTYRYLETKGKVQIGRLHLSNDKHEPLLIFQPNPTVHRPEHAV